MGCLVSVMLDDSPLAMMYKDNSAIENDALHSTKRIQLPVVEPLKSIVYISIVYSEKINNENMRYMPIINKI